MTFHKMSSKIPSKFSAIDHQDHEFVGKFHHVFTEVFSCQKHQFISPRSPSSSHTLDFGALQAFEGWTWGEKFEKLEWRF